MVLYLHLCGRGNVDFHTNIESETEVSELPILVSLHSA